MEIEILRSNQKTKTSNSSGLQASTGLFQGRHIFGELYGVNFHLLNDEEYLNQILKEAVALSGATLLNLQSNKFEPNGVTSLALLAESHASIHTYPEFRSLFLDVFTCGSVNPVIVFEHIKAKLKPEKYNFSTHERGWKKNV